MPSETQATSQKNKALNRSKQKNKGRYSPYLEVSINSLSKQRPDLQAEPATFRKT
jgi:hypothetical protein